MEISLIRVLIHEIPPGRCPVVAHPKRAIRMRHIGFSRVSPDVLQTPPKVFGIANDAVKTLFLPYPPPAFQKSIDVPRGVPLSSLKIRFQRVPAEWTHDEVGVIRHDHDGRKFRFLAIVVQQRIHQYFARPTIAKQAIANTLVEPVFDRGDGMTGSLLPGGFGFGRGPTFDTFTRLKVLRPFAFQRFQLGECLGRERVGETERDEISRGFLSPMR